MPRSADGRRAVREPAAPPRRKPRTRASKCGSIEQDAQSSNFEVQMQLDRLRQRQQSTKAELVINLKTAKALGLTVSNQMQLRADEVIE